MKIHNEFSWKWPGVHYIKPEFLKDNLAQNPVLSAIQEEIVLWVINKYGKLTGQELADRIISETVWKIERIRANRKNPNPVIRQKKILEYIVN